MKNKSELQHEVLSLHLTHPQGATKEDLMDILAVSHREHDVTGRPPLLPQYPVMLARKAKHLQPNELDTILDSPKGAWIAETKLDGVRAKLHLGPFGNRIDSRHRSDITYEYVEKTNGLPHLRDMRHFRPGTVLDGELLMPVRTINFGKTQTDSVLTSTTATVNSSSGRAIEIQEKVGYCSFYAFDILFNCGSDVRQLPYSERYKQLCDIHGSLVDYPFFKLPGIEKIEFTDFFKYIVRTGGEGIMLKRLDWPYISRGRSKGWYKLKKGKEIDVFITGFVPGEGEFSGLIGSLRISTLVGNEQVEIGAVQPGDLSFRQSISLADGSMHERMYNQVVKVSYMCKTKNNRLREVVLECFRPDKTRDDCTERI